MKKIALILILVFVSVSLGSLSAGIDMDYRSQVIFSSTLFLLICIALGLVNSIRKIWEQFLDFLNINNRNLKKSLLKMDNIHFEEQRDIILDLPDKNKSKKLFKVYELIRIEREKNKKTHTV